MRHPRGIRASENPESAVDKEAQLKGLARAFRQIMTDFAKNWERVCGLAIQVRDLHRERGATESELDAFVKKELGVKRPATFRNYVSAVEKGLIGKELKSTNAMKIARAPAQHIPALLLLHRSRSTRDIQRQVQAARGGGRVGEIVHRPDTPKAARFNAGERKAAMQVETVFAGEGVTPECPPTSLSLTGVSNTKLGARVTLAVVFGDDGVLYVYASENGERLPVAPLKVGPRHRDEP